MPALREVDDYVSLNVNDFLLSAALPALRHVAQYLYVTYNRRLESVDLSALEYVGEDLLVADNLVCAPLHVHISFSILDCLCVNTGLNHTPSFRFMTGA